MSDFYVKGIDRKLNIIFFIAFATIGILALTAVTYIIVFGFMLFGLDLDKKLVAILSAVILFIGTYSTAFSILFLIGVIIWLNFIVFESK